MILDKILNTIFSFGAAVVIFGAWGKIEHTAFGDKALTAGLLTETAIFFCYGLLEWRRRSGPDSMPDAETKREFIVDKRPITREEHFARAAQEGSVTRKEDLEALTSSIKEMSNLLSRIFRA